MKNKKVFFVWSLLFTLFLCVFSAYSVYFIWYPYPLFLAQQISKVFLLFTASVFIIGPVLVFLFYKENKKKFYFDLVVIVLLQLAAFGYGLNVLERGRVAWKVFVVDDIDLVSPVRMPPNSKMILENSPFSVGFFGSAIWVAAVYAEDPVIRQKQKNDELFDGIDMATRVETFQPISSQKESILNKLHPLNQLNSYNPPEKVSNILKENLLAFGWLPVKGTDQDMVALFDKQGEPLKIVNLRPWE